MTLLDLQRRIAAAERANPQEPDPLHGPPTGGERVPGDEAQQPPQAEAHRRRNAVARFEQDRDRALADPATSALKRARLTFEGAGISAQALSIMSGISRQTITRAERDPDSVSTSTLRRLAATLHVAPADVT